MEQYVFLIVSVVLMCNFSFSAVGYWWNRTFAYVTEIVFPCKRTPTYNHASARHSCLPSNNGFVHEEADTMNSPASRFSLHEEKGKGYPFATKTGQEQHVLHGYLLTWSCEETFEYKLRRMDRIEGASALLCVKCLCYRNHLPAQTSPRTTRPRIQHYLPALGSIPEGCGHCDREGPLCASQGIYLSPTIPQRNKEHHQFPKWWLDGGSLADITSKHIRLHHSILSMMRTCHFAEPRILHACLEVSNKVHEHD